MARELSTFPKRRPPGQRYPWDEWTNGRPWEIMRGEDYDISTENMRTNLHMRASSMGRKVKTQKVNGQQGEGLVFQFLPEQGGAMKPKDALLDEDTLLEALHTDTVEIYDRARTEVRYTTQKGHSRMYAAVRFKQKIDRAYAARSLQELVAAVNKWVRSKPSQGFLILEEAGRLDLSVERLVLKEDKPYHSLFPATTLQRAREKLG
jgi:hypothetical protein